MENEVSEFEKEFADYIGNKYCVVLASRLDALWIDFKVLEIGKENEVIIRKYSFISTINERNHHFRWLHIEFVH